MLSRQWTRRFAALALALFFLPLALTTIALAGPAERTLRTVVSTFRRLDLTTEQRSEIRQILQAHRDELSLLLSAQATARSALRDAIHQPEVNEPAVRLASAAVARSTEGFALERAEIFASVVAVLTPEQREILRSAAGRIEGLARRNVERQLDLGALATRTSLTPEQKAQIEAVLAAHRPEMEELLASYRSARETLGAAIRQPAVDAAAVSAAAAEVSRLETELAVERAEIYAEILAVLTPEQRAELAARVEQARQNVAEFLQLLLDMVTRMA